MRLINKLNAEPFQTFSLTGNDNQRIDVSMRYLPTQLRWIMDIDFRDTPINGIYVVNSPNFLRHFSNIIPFGMACETTDDFDPYRLEDFDTEYAKLYLLTREEIQAVESVFV